MRFERFVELIGKRFIWTIKTQVRSDFLAWGGVGSYVAEAIARSGIERIIICDYDLVENIEYQSSIGCYRFDNWNVEDRGHGAANQRYQSECKSLKPIRLRRPMKSSVKSSVWKPDYIADAIDDIDAKNILNQKQQSRRDIPFISSMGFCQQNCIRKLIKISTLNKNNCLSAC